MPIIHVENVGTLSKDQKKRLIEEITQTVVEVTGKPEKSVYIRIEEIAPENFGVGGQQLG